VSIWEELSMMTIPGLRIGLVASVVCAAATAAVLAKDNYGYQYADLTNVRTFAFREAVPVPGLSQPGPKCETPRLQDQTNSLIATQLENRGMRRNDEHPDVYVVTRRWFARRYTFYGPYDVTWDPAASAGLPWSCHSAWVGWNGWDQFNGWGGYNGGVYADLYDTLTVDLQDPATGAVLWRGSETRRVPQQSSMQDRHMTKTVTEVFEHFPVPGAVATTGHR
jgi:hypothetical protein